MRTLQTLRSKVNINKSTAGSVCVKFGIGTSASIGSSAVETPIGRVTFHIFPTDTHFLLSLADLNRLNVHYDNTRIVIISNPNGGEIPAQANFTFIKRCDQM